MHTQVGLLCLTGNGGQGCVQRVTPQGTAWAWLLWPEAPQGEAGLRVRRDLA